MSTAKTFGLELPEDGDGLSVVADDGHRFRILLRAPETPVATLLWLPALGVAARHYLPFADALAAHGIAVFVHEWRGHGSSNLRAGHDANWGYRELLLQDLPASMARIGTCFPSLRNIVGGHSLGGQLAACLLASSSPQTRQNTSRLWLIASGAPFWRVYPTYRRWLLPWVYRFLPWLADRKGALPGRSIGFGGKEARGVMHDWARTGLSGRYAGQDLTIDLDTLLADVVADVDAVLFRDDWLVPPSSLRFLIAKMRPQFVNIERLDAATLGTRADHFAWMKQPDAVATILVRHLQSQA